MSEKLKPCPFCGGKAILGQDEDNWYFVGCCSGLILSCYCDINYREDSLPRFADKEEAIEVWNRRPEE